MTSVRSLMPGTAQYSRRVFSSGLSIRSICHLNHSTADGRPASPYALQPPDSHSSLPNEWLRSVGSCGVIPERGHPAAGDKRGRRQLSTRAAFDRG
jgi:hypothetical protein